MARRHRIRAFYEATWPQARPLRESRRHLRAGKPQHWNEEMWTKFVASGIAAWEKMRAEQRAYFARTGGYLV